jgi:ABC-type Mn2+/Zn2+ transport system ATPase subunit
MPLPLITIDDITVRLRDKWLLNGASWQINAGEQWMVLGPNGAGKTTLAKAIAGLLPVVQGKIHYHAFGVTSPTDAIAYVASDARRDLWRRERDLDHGRGFAGRFNESTTIRKLIGDQLADLLPPPDMEHRLADVVERFKLETLLDKPAMAVSTGEMSRVLVARELIRNPKMLILDEPFDGLDPSGRQELMDMLDAAGRFRPAHAADHPPPRRDASRHHACADHPWGADRGRQRCEPSFPPVQCRLGSRIKATGSAPPDTSPGASRGLPAIFIGTADRHEGGDGSLWRHDYPGPIQLGGGGGRALGHHRPQRRREIHYPEINHR